MDGSLTLGELVRILEAVTALPETPAIAKLRDVIIDLLLKRVTQ